MRNEEPNFVAWDCYPTIVSFPSCRAKALSLKLSTRD